MKKLFLVFNLLVGILTLFAYPVRIESWHIRDDVKRLNAMNISVDYVNPATQTIIAYVHDDAEFSSLLNSGFQAEQITSADRKYANFIVPNPDETGNQTRNYLSIAEYTAFMQNTADQYPNICQLIQFGSSVQNRPLYFMRISDNIPVEENEPEFRYVSSMHGDEVVGYDMLIRLIQLLTSQYGINDRITDIVNNTEIWICPLYNPDGYVAHSRYNANGADLNRNFPMPVGSQHPDGMSWQPENIALMNHSNAQNINFSVNFHGGSLVTNYPWDYTYTLCPDNDLFIQAALTYSIHNTPMYNSSEFVHGITNGAAWYIVEGSLQDWVYANNGDMDLTIEVGEVKWPAASSLDTYWNQNQESILSLLEFVQNGVCGVVTNSAGEPLHANIHINTNCMDIMTDPQIGDYHRILLPGNYTITVSADGYQTAIRDINVIAGTATVANFVLQPAVMTNFSGTVISALGIPIAGATVKVTSGTSVFSALTNNSGVFSIINLPAGFCNIKIIAPSYADFITDFQINAENEPQIFVLPEPVFYDDFENGLANWTAQSPWAIITQSSNHVLTDSPSGNYSNNSSISVTNSTPFSLVNVVNPNLSFDLRYDLESGYDFFYVYTSANGSNWNTVATFSGNATTWTNYSFSLAAYQGSNLYLKFKLVSDNSVNADGVYLDNVKISGLPTNQTVYGDTDSNWIINSADCYNILEYSVGNNPLPELDPYPWEAFRVEAADVDDDGLVTATDAYYVNDRFQNYSSAFPALNGNAIDFDNPDYQFLFSDSVLSVQADQPANLRAMTINLINNSDLTIASLTWNEQTPELICACSPDFKMVSFINPSYVNTDLTTLLQFQIQTEQSAIHAMGKCNADDFDLTIQQTANEDENDVPVQTALLGNYPNPFSQSTSIRFSLAKNNMRAQLFVYNVKGQLVRTLADETFTKGIHTYNFDGLDNHHRKLGNGVYYYKLITPDASYTGKLLFYK